MGAAVEEDDERHRERHGQQDVRHRRRDERRPALLHAQERVGRLEVREAPEPEDREAADARVVPVAQHVGERRREGQRGQRDEGRDDRTVPSAVRAIRARASASSSVNQSRTSASARPPRRMIDPRMMNVRTVSATPRSAGVSSRVYSGSVTSASRPDTSAGDW